VRPGERFVVEGVVSEAAVEDPDEPVSERSERLVVGRSALALAVVQGSCAG
jgi:hypothetical protein